MRLLKPLNLWPVFDNSVFCEKLVYFFDFFIPMYLSQSISPCWYFYPWLRLLLLLLCKLSISILPFRKSWAIKIPKVRPNLFSLIIRKQIFFLSIVIQPNCNNLYERPQLSCINIIDLTYRKWTRNWVPIVVIVKYLKNFSA